MFCDLVDSTGIAAKLDAEEWCDLVGAYFEAASLAVTEMGGKVAKKLGDGLVALFGYPVAHENDVERAAHAARGIQRALTELNCKYDRIGKPALAAITMTQVPWWSMRLAKFSASYRTFQRDHRLWPTRLRFWSRGACSATSPAPHSWPKSAAAMNSKACPGQ
jgi:hypothetical protein